MSDWKNVQYKDGKYRTSEGGGGGGSSTFVGLDDVNFNNIQNGQVPKYNSTTQKWENANESVGGHTYSTTEQVAGTWIDGKPIYEKTYTNLSVSCSRDTYTHSGIIISDIDSVVRVPVAIDSNKQSVGLEIGMYTANKELALYVTSNPVTLVSFTIQYTKTTD